MGRPSQGRLLVVLSVVPCYLFVLLSFISSGRIPHPSIVLFFLSIYTCVVSYKKKSYQLIFLILNGPGGP